MASFAVGDVVTISPDAAPYSGQQAVVTRSSDGTRYGTSVRPVLHPDVKELAYDAEELSPVLVNGRPLRVGLVSA